jgi:hypothetical protein
MECCFCKKTYANEYILANHKKTTKKCLSIQANEVQRNDRKCSYCNKELSSKIRLTKHLLICKKKISEDAIEAVSKKLSTHVTKHVTLLRNDMEDKIEQATFELRTKHEEESYELRLKIKELEEQLTKKRKPMIENVANVEKIENIESNIEQQTNNITIYNVMSPEHVSEFFKQHYKLDTLLGGQKALARFVNEGFLKETPVYLCGDRSRQKFYIVADGKKIEDTNCDEIIGLTTPGMPHVQDVYENALFTKPDEVTEDEVHDNFQKIMVMEGDRSDFKSELSRVVPTLPMSPPLIPNKNTNNFNQMIRDIDNDCRKRGLYERQEKKQLTQKSETTDIENIETEPIKRPDVLGYSRGRLMIYRDKYSKEGIVKGPPDLMKRIESDSEARNEYMAYLTECH